MPKALVTGASGFIGGHLVDALVKRGDQVRCLVRRSSRVDHLPADKVEFAYADLRDSAGLAEAVEGIDVVYHLAAMTSAHRVADLHEANGEGTRRIVQACAAQPTPPVLVYLSSIAASGPTSREQVRSENDPPAPVSQYGRSKLAGEQACREHADRVPTSIVRAAIVFGPRDTDLLPMFRVLQNFRFHAVPTLNPPPLSFVYVEDLIRLLIRSAESAERLPSGQQADQAIGQGVYFASATQHPDYAEFGKMIRKLLNRPQAPMIYIPLWLVYGVAAINQSVSRLRGKNDTFNIDKIREAAQESWACSGEAACQDLGVCIEHSLEQRLEETISWYRQENWL